MAEDQNQRELEWIALARQGDPDAFLALSTRYLGVLRAQAARFVGRGAPERDDLIQEGLVGLYLAAMTYDEGRGTAFGAYAAACARNRMADAARRHGGPRNRPLNEALSLDSEAEALAAGESPQDQVELREQVRALLARLDSALTPLEKKALALYLGGCPRQRVPARSGMTLKAYDNALFRVRKKLRSGD